MENHHLYDPRNALGVDLPDCEYCQDTGWVEHKIPATVEAGVALDESVVSIRCHCKVNNEPEQ